MQLSGIIAYPITPFSDDGKKIQFDILGQTLEHLLDHGCDAIAPLGSTGESAYLSLEEWQQIAEYTVKTVNQRVPVIVGIGELTTRQAILKAKFAESIGADAIMVIPVSYWKLTDEEIFNYFEEIATSTSLPVMAYNNPATSGIDMSPELLVRMFENITNVTMVKESSGDIQRMHRLHELSGGGLPFYNGSNPLALEALCAGASGWCTAAPNLLGGLPKTLYQLITSEQLSAARAIFYQQLPLLRQMVIAGIPKVVKAGLAIQGIHAGSPRKPLHHTTTEEALSLREMLAEVNR
ncbi:dihydrodipicolinate synthase family protein [Photobacterium galatheae]|uniref:Dihydrodipicolinate synthase n=1 Tax=Photobacterium galatheae TaxID=1654360 RepID=A0A066RVC0_9GAMM|nr:dihydrodipicolinate synthase family protein [Photobacterium galatheae]KDM91632.1 dihydrodipicolinate synthase [Photobacterium galatheae]MCM0149706.1 dihydrodipicolinate synthase family protein [Photobacterium galatheae]